LKAKSKERLHAIGDEWFLAISLATTLVFALYSAKLEDALSNPLWLGLIFVWLFAVVLGSALSVVRHADHVAEILGEPYGTLVLTLAVTTIEVMMLHGENNPTLVRDTLFAVVMIILGGMVGSSLLLGGWRHREQHYNLQGANAYLGVIIPLTVLTLTLPNFTITTPGPTLSFPQQLFLFVMSIGLYLAFLAIQTGRHRGYFISDGSEETAPPALPKAAPSLR
jgi:Ca2+:H+ antiporter